MGINRNQAERMQVLLASADTSEGSSLSELVRAYGWSPEVAVSSAELENRLQGKGFHAVILDIDSLAADNRTIGRLAAASPRVAFLCISRERLHPQLQESIRQHVFACLAKPVDPDELGYWLKCIREDGRDHSTDDPSEKPNIKTEET